MKTIDIAEITAKEMNIGVYPKEAMTIPYIILAMPPPRYVAKSITPLTEATLPVLAERRGYMESIEVFIIDAAA